MSSTADEAEVKRARDLLQRDLAASAPNEKWVCDITYLSTWNGFRYLAFVLDYCSRRRANDRRRPSSLYLLTKRNPHRRSKRSSGFKLTHHAGTSWNSSGLETL
jgi:transposase InsO family protein